MGRPITYPADSGFKTCIGCCSAKPVSEFFEQTRADGYYARCKSCVSRVSADWYANNPGRRAVHRASVREHKARNKHIVMTHYSAGTVACECCGESNIGFLTIDHINNDGHIQRKANGTGGQLYGWLIKNQFPPGYRVLCFNCNCGRKHGPCPHTTAEFSFQHD